MINDAIASGIEFLKKTQENDGSFASYSSESLNFNKVQTHQSPFYASLILSCLNNLKPNADILQIKKKAADFLLTQKSKNWSYNYWVRNSKDSKTTPYPDDLDVTFCALSALFGYKQKLIGGKVIANIVDILTIFEKSEGGPYRTWIVPENAKPIWRDVDLVVNSNIAYFLSLVDVDLPKINSFIEDAVTQKKLNSPYYYSKLPVIYFISRFYKGKMKQNLSKQLKSEWDNPLHTALAISSLINFDNNKISNRHIQKLLSTQADGAWKAFPFVIEHNNSKKVIYAGSSSLTTAFCLEALGKYKAVSSQATSNQKTGDVGNTEKIKKQIIDKVKKRYFKMGAQVYGSAQKVISIVEGMDNKNHITLLPYFMRSALGNKGIDITDDQIIELGTANVFGWIAYTIYDDFLDMEGKGEMLPVANIALRELTGIFKDTPFYHSLMDRLDNANAWEMKFCRGSNNKKLPKFGNLRIIADKSIGIAITPIALLLPLGFDENSSEVKTLISFFTDYLIARQLNDDAHDWEDDLKKGHITPVTAMVLKNLVLNPSSKPQEIFWNNVVIRVCDLIDIHLENARAFLQEITCITNPSVFEGFLDPLSQMTKKTRQERAQTIDFLKAYKEEGNI